MSEEYPNFGGYEVERNDYASSRYAVLPVPFDLTASYMKGTADGPAAILRASEQVEFFDSKLGGVFTDVGIATLTPVEPSDDSAQMMRRIQTASAKAFADGKFLLTLGGEHSITGPVVRAAAEFHKPISVLQVDAHADLRDAYEGDKNSHASVMRRVLEVTPNIAQVGIRNYSLEASQNCKKQVADFITPDVIRTDPAWIKRTLDLLPENSNVYVTIDIDGLDPSVAPGTGTPEPDGLSWKNLIDLLEATCSSRKVIGADIVEVRPIPPNHCTEFMAAKLAYKIIALTQV